MQEASSIASASCSNLLVGGLILDHQGRDWIDREAVGRQSYLNIIQYCCGRLAESNRQPIHSAWGERGSLLIS